MIISQVTNQCRLAFVILALFVASNLTACKANSNYFKNSSASVGSDGGSVDADAGFRIRLKKKDGVEAYLHKFGDTAADCEVPLADIDTPTRIQCMLSMMEYDLWFYGYETEMSIPAGVCRFVEDAPHRYLNARVGVGIKSIAMDTLDGRIQSCTIDGIAGTVAAGGTSCSGPEGTVTAAGDVSCVYNYSDTNQTGLNCCIGEVSVALSARATGSTDVTNSTAVIDHGGDPVNCLFSAHDYIDNWPKSTELKASDAIWEVGGGAFVRSTKVPGTQTLYSAKKRFGSSSNVMNAGFHDWTAYATDPSTWITTHTTPIAMNLPADLGPDGNSNTGTGADTIGFLRDGSETYDCLNNAGEIKHQIKVFVNEWNTIEDFQSYYEDGAAASAVDPTRTGTAGVNCSAINNGLTCNTFWGFDDLTNAYGASEFPLEWGRPRP